MKATKKSGAMSIPCCIFLRCSDRKLEAFDWEFGLRSRRSQGYCKYDSQPANHSPWPKNHAIRITARAEYPRRMIAGIDSTSPHVIQVVDQAQLLQTEYQITNSNTIADEDGVGGGVVDYLGCRGFVNNSKAEFGENYDNLKSQCSIKMAKRIEAREVVEVCNDANVIDIVSEEMEQIKLKDIDKDGKLGLMAKDKIKALIGRSPDDWDSIMMREYFELFGGFYVD